MSNLSELLKFGKLLSDYQGVYRRLRVPGQNRNENDPEHSFKLAMLAWHVIASRQLNLNLELALRYALVHDLVEIYAGDTYVFTTNKQMLASKESRERAAADKLTAEFPTLAADIIAYEKRHDDESRFIYALDKLEPIISIYLDGGRTWQELGITIEMISENKTAKVAVSPPVAEYFSELIAELKTRENELFPKERLSDAP